MAETTVAPITCNHCSNISHMEIRATGLDKQEFEGPDEPPIEFGKIYFVLKCPSCKKISIAYSDWDEDMQEEDSSYEILYPPKSSDAPLGLPEKIRRTYLSAEKLKDIDANAYGILMRRILEQVCIEKGAQGDDLAKMLKSLSDNGEIPKNLSEVAKGIRILGNVGAHAFIGDLGKNEIPLIKALTNAILEYLYTAPHLAQMAQKKYDNIKASQ